VEQLLKTASGVTSSSSVVETVYKRTAGNPFFVTQIAQLISQEGGEWSGDIPQALRDAIGQQLSRLSDACHRLLTVTAVMGQEFGFSALERVADRPDEDLLDVISLWNLASPDALIQAFAEAGVRAGEWLRLQTPEAIEAIKRFVHHEVSLYEQEGVFRVPLGAVLASAVKRSS
jgi:hypothetical protein